LRKEGSWNSIVLVVFNLNIKERLGGCFGGHFYLDMGSIRVFFRRRIRRLSLRVFFSGTIISLAQEILQEHPDLQF
jgi:capsule polysaccharide export protein KpsC/LpsZ